MGTTKSKHQIEITAVDKASATFNNLEKTISRLGVTIGAASIGAAFVNATKAAIDFERGLAKTATLLPKANRDMTQFARGLESIRSRGLGGSLDELTEGLYQTISAGVPATNAINFLDTASKAAKAGFTDMKTAVDGLTTVLNAYKISAENVSSVSDVLFVTQNRGKTTFGEMAGTLGQLLPIAASAGARFDEIAAAISTLTIQGIPTAVAITGLRATIAAFIEKGDGGKIASLGFAGALKELESQTGGNQKKLQDYLGRVEALNTVLALTGNNTNQFASDLRATADAAGIADDAVSTYMDNTAGSIDRLSGMFEVYKQRFGKSFASTLFSKENTDEIQKDADIIGGIIETLARGIAFNLRAPIEVVKEFAAQLRGVWESWSSTFAKDPLFNANSPYRVGGSYFGGSSNQTTGSTAPQITARMPYGEDVSALTRESLWGWAARKAAEDLSKLSQGAASAENGLRRITYTTIDARVLSSRLGRGVIDPSVRAANGFLFPEDNRTSFMDRLRNNISRSQTSDLPTFTPATEDIDKLNERIQAIAPAFQYAMSAVTNTIVQGAITGALKIKDVFNALRNAILQILADIAARAATAGILSLLFPGIGLAGMFKGLGTGQFTSPGTSFRPSPIGANPGVGLSRFGGGGVTVNINAPIYGDQQAIRRQINDAVKQASRGQNNLSR